MKGIQCPQCTGKGRQFVHLNTTDPATHGFQWVDCDTCQGSGTVNQATLDAIDKGKAMRDDRVRRKMSLREEATRLGIGVAELSRMEQGRTPTKTEPES